MKLLLSPDARLHSDFDKDLAEDAENIIEALDKLQPIFSALFPSQPRNFALHHHDLSLRNILVDLQHIRLRESSTGSVSVLDPTGKTRTHSSCVVQRLQKRSHLPQEIRIWSGWSAGRTGKSCLVFDKELGETRHDDDGRDEIRREFRKELDIVGISSKMAQDWVKEYGERCMNILSANVVSGV